MEEKKFFQTKAGGLTICFLVIMAAFVLIMLGLGAENTVLCAIGMVLIVVAFAYSPIRVYILKR